MMFNQEKEKFGEDSRGWDEEGCHPEKQWVFSPTYGECNMLMSPLLV